MKQVIVTDFCTACGNCFSKSDFFKKARSGRAKVLAPNLIKEADFNKIKGIIDECPAKAIEVTTARYRELADISEIDKKFSLFKIFGSLELSEINEPDSLALRMIAVAKNRGADTYDKLEHMIMNIVSNIELSNRNITVDGDYVSIKCQMKSRSHRLNMDKYEIKKYFNLPDSHLTIYKNGENFEILVNKGILIRIFVLTKIVDVYGKGVNNLSKEEVVDFTKDFIREKFFPEEVSEKPMAIEPPVEEVKEDLAKEETVIQEEIKKQMTEEDLERDRLIRERLQKLKNRPTREELFKEPFKPEFSKEELTDQDVDREALIRERLQKLRNRPANEGQTQRQIVKAETVQEKQEELVKREPEQIQSVKKPVPLEAQMKSQVLQAEEEAKEKVLESVKRRISPDEQLRRRAQAAENQAEERKLEPVRRPMSPDEQLRRRAQAAENQAEEKRLEPVRRQISPDEQLRRRAQAAENQAEERKLEPVRRQISPDEQLRRRAQAAENQAEEKRLEPVRRQISPDEQLRRRTQAAENQAEEKRLEPIRRQISPDEQLRRRTQAVENQAEERKLEPARRQISPDEQLRRRAQAVENQAEERILEPVRRQISPDEQLRRREQAAENQAEEERILESVRRPIPSEDQLLGQERNIIQEAIEPPKPISSQEQLLGQEVKETEVTQPVESQEETQEQLLEEKTNEVQAISKAAQEEPIQGETVDRESLIRERFRKLRENQGRDGIVKEETIKKQPVEKEQVQEQSVPAEPLDRKSQIRERFRQLREKQADEISTKEQPSKIEESLKKEAIKQVIKQAIEEEDIKPIEEDEISVSYEDTNRALQVYGIGEDYEDYNSLEEPPIVTILNIFGNLDLDNIYKADKFSTDMLNSVANKSDDAYKKLEHVVFVNILESQFRHMSILIKRDYITIKSGTKSGVYSLIAEREKIVKRFGISSNIKSDEILDISLDEEGFEMVIGKTLLNKMFLLTALYEKYDKEVNNMSSSNVETYADTLMEEFIVRNKFKIRDMLPETVMITEYDTAMYQETYDIRHLFSEEKMHQIATRRDVAAIFDRKFYSLDGRDLSAAVENLKLKCMSLVNGVNTIGYIVNFYTGETDYD